MTTAKTTEDKKPTLAQLRARCGKRYLGILNHASKRWQMMSLLKAINSDDDDDDETGLNQVEALMTMTDLVFGEDRQAIFDHFNDDAEKVDAFMNEVMQSNAAKK